MVTTVTAPTGMIVISAVTVAVWLWRSTHWWRPPLLAGSMLLAVTGIVGVKWIAERRRPPIADMLLGADHSYSFPSGHTLATTTFVLVLVYLAFFRPRAADDAAAPGLPPHPARWWALAAGALAIATVAFSRLYLGYHWLTDVTGAFVLALAILGLVIGVDAWRPTARRVPQSTRAPRCVTG